MARMERDNSRNEFLMDGCMISYFGFTNIMLIPVKNGTAPRFGMQGWLPGLQERNRYAVPASRNWLAFVDAHRASALVAEAIAPFPMPVGHPLLSTLEGFSIIPENKQIPLIIIDLVLP